MSAIRCTVEPRMPSGVPALVESVVFGTSGLRYRRLDVAAQLGRLHDPVFVCAYRADALVGVYALDRRALSVDGRAVIGVYRGTLCVASDAQGSGVGAALAARGREWIDALADGSGEAVLSWGCIDADNTRSLTLLEREGASDTGALAMLMSYRQWRRERVALEALAPGRDPREVAVLAATLADCALRDVTPSALPGLALLDGAGLRVSARVALSGYRIETMGRALDAAVRVFVTPFPPARRRFDVNAFRYVRFSDVAVRDGCERDWPRFVATVLARYGVHFGMVFVDPASALHERIAGNGRPASGSLRLMTRWSRPDPVGRDERRGAAGPEGTAPRDETPRSGGEAALDGPVALVPVDG